MHISSDDRKLIKKKIQECFGVTMKWNCGSNANRRDYLSIIRRTIGVELSKVTNYQASVALRYLADTDEPDVAKLILDSMSCMPQEKPAQYIDTMIKHAVVSRKSQRFNAPLMTYEQRQSEALNDYVQRREVQKFSSRHFYRSREWKELRLLMLSAYRVCRLCGNGPAQGKVLHVDHIKPRSLWPELSLSKENLQVICADCNTAKSNTVIERY